MGQHCSCFTERQRRKVQRRSSDDYTMDSESWSTTEEDRFDIDIHSHLQEEIEALEENQGLLRASERFPFHGTAPFNHPENVRLSSTCVEFESRDKHDEGGNCDLADTLNDDVVLDLADILRNYQEATGVIDTGSGDLECIMCLDTFSEVNPKLRTLCNCGMNRTNFHLSCLIEWMQHDPTCPICRTFLYYED
uniref:RING-type E3 ubiquitin transferase n=1 Tax=Albugo laibachii Nc14 TaxID=890382 RepID=F0WFD8_9STRA|nr:conserved hypothetical protein [Albugo laibachii Nc14]|eukprot:CCA19920.1 conserved hypothetical protein [Albugo laibachii Nc14]